MKKNLLTLAMAAITWMSASATNRNCATVDNQNRLIQEDPTLEQRQLDIEQHTNSFITNKQKGTNQIQSVITIPVVFHVLYNTTAQNISDALINAQLAQLNADYAKLNSDAANVPSAFSSLAANTGIQFCKAQRDPSGNATTGIIRKSTTVSSFSTNDNMKRNANGGSDAWPASAYLNVWVCNMSGGILGYAQFPGGAAATDGVVLHYTSVGSLTTFNSAGAPYNKGRTATHEVGHWLNLFHIWGDDGTSCTGSDNVSDTPNQADEHYGCPTFPQVSCSNGPNGDMFMNYMDYTDDACMNMFTTGQSNRMNALFSTGGSRASLSTSQGCTPPTGGGSCGTPTSLSASSITTSSATLSWAAVAGATSYNLGYKLGSASTYTTVSVAGTSYALSGLTANTTYNYQVQAVCSTTGTYSPVSSFTTSTTGTTCNDTYESNNTSSTAKVISVNSTISATIGTATDVDWYRFTTVSPNTRVRLTLANLPFDYDITLYNSSLTSLRTGTNGGTTSEVLTYNTSTARTYYVRVYGYNGAFSASSCYSLNVAVQSTNFREAAEMQIEEVNNLELNMYPNPASNQVTFDIFSKMNANVAITIVDFLGRSIKNESLQCTEGINKMTLPLNDIQAGIYFITINSGNEHITQKLIVE